MEFRDVSFAYGPERKALEDITFTVEPGIRVGIAGATGAGKTTLVNLLTRFYDPRRARSCSTASTCATTSLDDLRSQFAIVLQEPVLFSTSDRARTSPTAARTPTSARSRRLRRRRTSHEFICGLPDGYDTVVGERGMRLSGGERQRLSLARAFLKDAPILILDEPTSSVDVQDGGDDHGRDGAPDGTGARRFMIAHRLSTLDRCDMRLEIEGGRIVTEPSRPSPPASRSEPKPLSEHPAVKAWRGLGGATPRHITALARGKRLRRGSTFRLEAAGPSQTNVIAKLSGGRPRKWSRAVYSELLPRVALPSLRYYGQAPEGDGELRWIFLEDAGSERYSAADPEHRRLAARWLATIQLHATESWKVPICRRRGPGTTSFTC